MRWTETCILRKKAYAPDDEGVMQENVTEREVFCNSYTLATQAWSTAKLADYTADDEIQLRTVDYGGELDVLYRGSEYSVQHVMNQGDNTRLILKHERSDDRDLEEDES